MQTYCYKKNSKLLDIVSVITANRVQRKIISIVLGWQLVSYSVKCITSGMCHSCQYKIIINKD